MRSLPIIAEIYAQGKISHDNPLSVCYNKNCKFTYCHESDACEKDVEKWTQN